MKILVLNSGSSSQKSCLYEIGESLPDNPPACLWQAKIEWHGEFADAEIRSGPGSAKTIRLKISSRAHAIEQMLDSMWKGESKAVSALSEIDIVGHRVVHGGPKFEDPIVITPEVKSAIADVSAFAPLHNRAELEGMETIEKLLGKNVPQVAVFDTGFHKTMPLSAAVYSGPYDWFEAGIRRYGFHGINHKYCARRAAHLLRRDAESLRLVSCHLGNGCSLAAIRNGKSVDTTMGFTPLEGLMMGTRSGSVDPGILTYLMRQQHLSGEQLDDLLNQHSGLLGISGISGDMREILQAVESGHERAKLAFDIYIHRLRSGIGAMIAVLGGIDALIFTAGVGENSPEVRAAACDNLRYAGVELDPEKNAQSTPDCDISAAASSVRVLTIRAQEDWEIARDCWKLENAGLRS
ncbi:MAG TPA: acetate kinase [Candidatus Dormibacteraeota bacterium]|jgi:acetate kinase|nr:acetate kinase [Candidatus Dormibacteraeota bacterium]